MASIFKFTSIVLIISLISKVLGLLRDILLVGELGAGASTDVFYGAMNVIEFFILFSGLNAMKSVGTSTYTMIKQENRGRSAYLTSLIVILISYGIVLSFLLFMFSKFVTIIFLPGFSIDNRILASRLVRILSFMIVAKGLSLILGNLMAVEKRFVVQNIFMPITNLVVIVTLFLSPSHLIIRNMAFAIMISWMFSAMVQLIILSNFGKEIIRISLTDLKNYGKLFFNTGYPLLFVTTTFALASSTDKIIASFFKEGTITSINLASMICFMPLQLILTPISNVFFPHFSKLYHAGKINELERDFNKGQLLVSLIFVPIVIIFLFFGKDIVEIAFLRKNFSQSNLHVVSQYLFVYCFALIFNAYYSLTTFIYQGARKNKTIGLIGIIGYAVNIICSISISFILNNPIGIPLGTVCAFIFFSIYSNIKMEKTFKITFKRINIFYSIFIGLVVFGVALLIRLIPIEISLSTTFINKSLTLLIRVILLLILSSILLYPIVIKKVLVLLKSQD